MSLSRCHVIKNVIDQFSYYRRYSGIHYIFASHRIKQEIDKYNSISIIAAFPFKFSWHLEFIYRKKESYYHFITFAVKIFFTDNMTLTFNRVLILILQIYILCAINIYAGIMYPDIINNPIINKHILMFNLYTYNIITKIIILHISKHFTTYYSYIL